MTEAMTPERRAEIEAYVKVLVGVRRTASVSALRDCLTEIDRLKDAVLSEREACAAICDAHPATVVVEREQKRNGRKLSPEAWDDINTEERGEKIASEILAKAIRARSEAKP